MTAIFPHSAGVGRTGTFIAVDNILEQIGKEQLVDVPGIITKIRQRRMKMVQNYVSPWLAEQSWELQSMTVIVAFAM